MEWYDIKDNMKRKSHYKRTFISLETHMQCGRNDGDVWRNNEDHHNAIFPYSKASKEDLDKLPSSI